MKVLLVGSGGREHSLALALSKSAQLSHLYTAPGNTGTAIIGQNIPIKETDIVSLLQFVDDNGVDLTIVGPEAPLVAGIVDAFNEKGHPIIGPSKIAAQLEGSKAWAKSMMQKCNIPTAAYNVFSKYKTALDHIETNPYPMVIKADGLAAGKGVTIAHTKDDALNALKDCFIDQKFKEAGAKVVIESFLKGEEASIFAFTDGKTIVPMVPAQDHKAIYDGDKGPNTGGMGAYSPTPVVTDIIYQKVLTQVFNPLLKGFQDENIDYIGIIYAGIMIKETDINVVEFNVRFGDPETQVVLPRLKTDLLDIFIAMTEKKLSEINIEWSNHAVVDVVLAAEGYPESYEKGNLITGIETCNQIEGCHVVHAGVKEENGHLLTNGGRILAVVAESTDLETAIEKAYEGVNAIKFEGKYFRTDIAHKAFQH
jgi:phosphoribosylamine--glycine ligase